MRRFIWNYRTPISFALTAAFAVTAVLRPEWLAYGAFGFLGLLAFGAIWCVIYCAMSAILEAIK